MHALSERPIETAVDDKEKIVETKNPGCTPFPTTPSTTPMTTTRSWVENHREFRRRRSQLS